MPKDTSSSKSSTGVSAKTRLMGLTGLIVMGVIGFFAVSLSGGGHMMGPTHIEPGNVGLVIDNYNGTVERNLMDAGTHWQGPWETVIEVPTAQRTMSLIGAPSDSGQSVSGVQVNTVSNMLTVDVSVQYQITKEHAADLYHSYQDQFADINRFENENLEPAVKGAINYAIGDMDTATALTTPG
jgi:regulator of protease activity HflC (stomatin/prohibitin superfamily)